MDIPEYCPKQDCDGQCVKEKYSEALTLNYLGSQYVTVELVYCDTCGMIIDSNFMK